MHNPSLSWGPLRTTVCASLSVRRCQGLGVGPPALSISPALSQPLPRPPALALSQAPLCLWLHVTRSPPNSAPKHLGAQLTALAQEAEPTHPSPCHLRPHFPLDE